MSDPLVSIITPLYNYQRFIPQCIQSVQQQTYTNWEMIIIDDCSQDLSFQVAQRFQSPKIKVGKTKTNMGCAFVRNEAIIKSQGELITILDADDMLTKDSLELRVKFFQENDVPLIHARAFELEGNIRLATAYQQDFPLKSGAIIHGGTLLYDRQLHVDYGLYDEDLRCRVDKEMAIRLFANSIATGLIDNKLFTRRLYCAHTITIKQNMMDAQYALQKLLSTIRAHNKIGNVKHKKLDDTVSYHRLHVKSMTKVRDCDDKLNQKTTAIMYANLIKRAKEGINSTNTRMLD